MGEAKQRRITGAPSSAPTPRLTQYLVFLTPDQRDQFETEVAAVNTSRTAAALPLISRADFIATAVDSMVTGLKAAREAEDKERAEPTPTEAAMETGA